MGLDNPLHIAVLLIIALMVFGAKRLPEMGRSLGDGMRGFKDALNPDTRAAAAVVPAAVLQPATPPVSAAMPAPAPAPGEREAEQQERTAA